MNRPNIEGILPELVDEYAVLSQEEVTDLRAYIAQLEKVVEATKADRSASVSANRWVTFENAMVQRVTWQGVYPDGSVWMALPVVSPEWLAALDAALAELEGE